MCQVCRRSFIRGAAALGATGFFSSSLMAQAPRGDAGALRLPARGEFTIANAYVMTMDSVLGDIADGSVHVRNGEIVAVGKDVNGGGGIRCSAASPATSRKTAISRLSRASVSR